MSNRIIDILVLIIIGIYTLIEIFIVAKNLLADLKSSYIGIASTYIFNYLIFDILTMLLIVHIFFYKNGLGNSTLLFFYACQAVTLFDGTIFLIKKYNFTHIKYEAILTAFLQVLKYMSLTFLVSLLIFKKSSITYFDSYLQGIFAINTSFIQNLNYARVIIFIIRSAPIMVLDAMWISSISKKYNKLEKSYFTKSANKPIYTFITSQALFSFMMFMSPKNDFEIFFILTVYYMLKLSCCTCILKWMKNRDMEKIETNAILRSKKNV